MNGNEIKDHLNLVLEKLFLRHPTLRKFFKDIYFAGGCIRSLVEGEPPKDYDIFFKSPLALANFVCKANEEVLGRKTLNSVLFKIEEKEIQFITLTSNNPIIEVNSFDFTFNQNFYDISNEVLYIRDEEIIKDKKMVLNYECRNPFDTFFRIFKFARRGYELPDQESLDRMAVRITQLDPIRTKDDFLASTRMCSSEAVSSGKLNFLGD